MRPAHPGDIAILVAHDDLGNGYNVGKEFEVIRQCSCDSAAWDCRPAQPVTTVLRGGWAVQTMGRVCFRKAGLKVKEDPDAGKVPEEEELIPFGGVKVAFYKPTNGGRS